MMLVSEARSKIGMEIRSTHPHAFKSGEWGEILGIVYKLTDGGSLLCWCYSIIWPDGLTDLWPIEDQSANYQYRGEPLTFTQDPELELEVPDLPLVVPVEPAPRHQWRLEHASSRHGLEMAGKVRVVCKCGWKGRYSKDAPGAVREFEEHESQEEDILF